MEKKKNSRKNKNRLRKLSLLLLPFALLIIIVCGFLIYTLIDITHRPLFISPVINSNPNNQPDDNAFQASLERALQEQKIAYSAILKVSGVDYQIKLENSPGEVIISSQKDLYQEISSLQYILSRLTMEGKQFSKLDLRFDKPVIVLK